jgi:hypothetical protein
MFSPITISPASVVIVVLATLLSAFDGLFCFFAASFSSGPDDVRLRIALFVPAALWIVALSCLKFPRSGLLVYWIVLLSSIILFVQPHNPNGLRYPIFGHAYNLRFAIAGGVLLAVNCVLPVRDSSGSIL